jgi:hypothetical protein
MEKRIHWSQLLPAQISPRAQRCGGLEVLGFQSPGHGVFKIGEIGHAV